MSFFPYQLTSEQPFSFILIFQIFNLVFHLSASISKFYNIVMRLYVIFFIKFLTLIFFHQHLYNYSYSPPCYKTQPFFKFCLQLHANSSFQLLAFISLYKHLNTKHFSLQHSSRLTNTHLLYLNSSHQFFTTNFFPYSF